MIRVGILGAGNIARSMAATLRAMRQRDRGSVELTAVGSRSLEKARAFAEREGFARAWGSYEELLSDDVDLIYVASPHSEHAEHVRQCVLHGKAVLCEKAFTANARQAEEVLALAEERRVLVTEAIWTRYMPSRFMIDQLIRDGAIGEVRLLTANLGYATEHIERILRPELAGGALLDVGVYALNFASMVLGDGILRRESSAVMLPTGVDRTDSVTYHYADGVMAQLMATCACRTDRRGIIYGTRGRIEVENINDPTRIEVWESDGPCTHPARILDVPPQLTGYEYEVEACIRALTAGDIECPEMPHAETIEIMRQMDALRADWGMVYPFD